MPSSFEFVGGDLALDFVNTVSWDPVGRRDERFDSFGSLVEWGMAATVLSPSGRDALELQAYESSERARRLLERALLVRELLHRLFIEIAAKRPVDPTLTAAFNDLLSPALSRLRLSPPADALVWGEPQGLDALLDPVLWSAAQLLASPRRERLRSCANLHCGWVFLDLSRNGRRRWCDMSECGNRAKARRYYERHRNRTARPPVQ
jgi:predicted RNA-binding Zn ribbon-like protein